MMGIEDQVKMTRRPFFRGKIVATQLSLPEMGCEPYHFIQWSFKPEGWTSPTAIRECDLKLQGINWAQRSE